MYYAYIYIYTIVDPSVILFLHLFFFQLERIQFGCCIFPKYTFTIYLD